MDTKPQSESHVLKTFNSDSFELHVHEEDESDCLLLSLYFFDHEQGRKRAVTMCSCCTAELVALLKEAMDFAEQVSQK
jgi:hypothetical protein